MQTILGDKIIIDHYLKRKTEYKPCEEYPYTKRHKEWIEVKFKEPQVVMIIGVRNLCNGTTFREDSNNFFEPEEYFKAYLVVDSLYRKPFLCKQ